MDSILDFIGEGTRSLDEIDEVFEYFLKQEIYTDVTFSVKGGDDWVDFSAHKLIISFWSPVLADMCYNHPKQTNGAIKIKNITPKVFEAVLKFMYGCISSLQLEDIPFCLKLYKAAVVFEIDALKNLCSVVFICDTPNKNNVFQLLEAAKLIDSEILVQRCYRILQEKTGEVLTAQELCNITPAMLLTILEMPRVSFTSEYELFSWVLAWVKNELLKYRYLRTFKDILRDFLPYLNFLNLTPEEFAKLYKNRKGDLMSEQEGFSIFMNMALPGSHPLPSWCSMKPRDREYRYQPSMIESIWKFLMKLFGS